MRHGIVAVIVAFSAVEAQSTGGTLKVLSPAPPTRGLYLCITDSIAAANGDPRIQCEVGGDTNFVIRRDTISSISRPLGIASVADSLTLFDYWNRELRSAWIARLGGPPTDIGATSRMSHYFEAVWDRTNGVRDIVSLTRLGQGRVALKWASFDCRANAPARMIACR